MADLQIKYSDGVVRVHSLDKKKILLGSSKKCDIRLTGDDVAAHHATVSMVGDRFRIDAEEGGKINLNGKPTSGALLRDRDAMRIGDCKLVFVAADAVEEKKPARKDKEPAEKVPAGNKLQDEYHTPLLSQWWFRGIVAGLLALFGFGGYFYVSNRAKAANDLYTKALTARDNKAYGEAIKLFHEFEKEYSSDERKEMAHVLAHESQFRQVAESPSKDEATVKKAIEEGQAFFKECGKTKSFKEKGKDFAKLFGDLSLATAKAARDLPDEKLIPLANQVLKMMEEQFRPDDRPTDTVNEIGNTVREASLMVEKDGRRKSALQKVKDAVAAKKAMDVYSVHRELYNLYPEMRKDNAFLAERKKARDQERDLVKFEPVPVKNATPPSEINTPLPANIVNRKTESSAKANGTPLPVMVADTLYMLDAGDGSTLWRVVLGVDPAFEPSTITTARGAEPALLVHSTLHGAVALLDIKTGKKLWSQSIDMIKPRWSSQPLSANGEIYIVSQSSGGKADEGRLIVLNAGTGAPVGQYVFPQRLTGSPSFDAERQRVLVLGEQVSLYSIDSKAQQCEMAIPVDHEYESVLSSPIFEGRYLFLLETLNEDKSRLRCFVLSASAPEAREKQAIEIRGRAYHSPVLEGGKLYLTTDQNHFSVFEVADQKDEKSLTAVASSAVQFEKKVPFQPYPVVPNDREIWTISDVIRSYDTKIGPVVSTTMFEMPLNALPSQRPIVTKDIVAIVVRQPKPSNAVAVLALKRTDGKEFWRCEMGRAPDAVTVGKDGLSVVQGDVKQSISIEQIKSGKIIDLPLVIREKKPGEKLERFVPKSLSEWTEGVLQWSGIGSNTLSLFDQAGKVSRIVLPSPFSARPVLLGKWVICPCADGRLYSYDPVKSAESADPYIGPYERGQPVPLGPVTVLDDKTALQVAKIKLIKLELDKSGKFPRFRASLEVPLEGNQADYLSKIGNSAYLAIDREVRIFNPADLKMTKKIELGAAVAREPMVVNKLVVYVTTKGELVAIDTEKLSLAWKAPLPNRSTVGWALLGEQIVLAYSDGSTSKVDVATGKLTAGPSAKRATAEGPWVVGNELVGLAPDGGLVMFQ